MANRIPTSTREEVYKRANHQCELCLSTHVDGIHHIIPRRKRIHRPETLILLCKRHHDLAHGPMQIHLQDGLQLYYKMKGYDNDEIRELMGGKYYLNEERMMDIVRLHFLELYKNERMINFG